MLTWRVRISAVKDPSCISCSFWSAWMTRPKHPAPGKNGGCFSCGYSCDIFRNVQKDTAVIVGSSTSSGVRWCLVGNYHGRQRTRHRKMFFLLKREGSFACIILTKFLAASTSWRQSFQYCRFAFKTLVVCCLSGFWYYIPVLIQLNIINRVVIAWLNLSPSQMANPGSSSCTYHLIHIDERIVSFYPVSVYSHHIDF